MTSEKRFENSPWAACLPLPIAENSGPQAAAETQTTVMKRPHLSHRRGRGRDLNLSRLDHFLTQTEISIEPFEHVFGDPDSRQHYKQTYWRVSLPDRLISDRARPFSASDSAIIIFECGLCGECGFETILARAVGNTVVWINIPSNNERSILPEYLALAPNEILVFNAADYEATLNRGHLRYLDPVGQDEIALFVRCLQFPNKELVLYRIPDTPDDQYGDGLLTSVRDAVICHADSIRVSSAPTEVVEFRIGLDLEGFPEAVWRFGETSEGVAVCLDQYPCFPIWLSGASIDKIGADWS